MNERAKKLVIFGQGELAEVAHHYFSDRTPNLVAAFTVDGAFVKADRFCGLPVVPFEQVAQSFPPADHDFFVAVGYRDLNRFRAARCVAARRLGYELASYISPDAVVWNGFRHGGNCFVLEHNTIQPFATIGSNVFLWSGNHIGHHARIADDCFIASHVVVSGGVHIGEGCFIGVNVTIRDHVTIGARCVLGAGALILENTMDEGVYAVKGTERSRVPSTRLRHL